ncbi:MAG TPA: ankyrin repeat domain-containing protein [Thermoanaerobaculia bacterium]|nr:ankyrin repeat domain-containing protein [Thermoanaerobaculia bacterium]
MRLLAAALALLIALPALGEDVLFPLYKSYVKAIDDGDLAAAKKHLSAGKARMLRDKSKEEALSSLNVISPKEDLRMHKEIFDGDDATLIVVANVAETESAGHIEFVREDGKWKILSELWDIGGDPDQAPVEPGPQPVTEKQREAIRKLREMGFAAPGPEFLVSSAVTGDLDAVKLFVQAGYDVDTMAGGAPAIVRAAMFGHPAIVLYLIEAGADVNAQDDIHTTALMRIADKCTATDAVRALLRAGAKTDLESDGGATALQLAEWSECKDNADLIRAAGEE